MNKSKVKPRVLAIIEHILVEYAETWRLLAAYDNGTLTQEEIEHLIETKEDLLSKHGPVV